MKSGDSSRNIAAWLAALWAIAFAVPSFYWAVGGQLGSETIADDLDEALGAAAQDWVIVATGLLKLALGAFALSFDFSRFAAGLRRWRIYAGTLVAVLLVAYGLVGFFDHFTMVVGVRSTPPALGDYAARWHAFFWDPVWLLGGVLLGLATRRYASAYAA